jgi:hypothetical protein
LFATVAISDSLRPLTSSSRWKVSASTVRRPPNKQRYAGLQTSHRVGQRLRAHEEARQWIIEHPDETVAIISAGAKITPEEAKLMLGRLDFTRPTITKSDYDKIGAFGDLLKPPPD